MIEDYILYNKTTGSIKGFGRINRELDQSRPDDPSTVSSYIERRMASESDLDVLYRPRAILPNDEFMKVVDGTIVDKSKAEKDVITQAKDDEEKINVEIEALTRATAIQSLKDRQELPVDYMDTKI